MNPIARELEQSEPSGSHSVVVGLIDGQRLFGRLRQFNSQDLRFLLLPEPLDLTAFAARELARDEIAYVAFPRASGPVLDPAAEQERWRLRSVGGEEWLVYVVAHSVADSVGFAARPVGDSTYEHVYFYRQGLLSSERDVPLGTILIASGVLGPAALEEGLSRQRRQRSMPIGQILIEQHKVDPLTVTEAVDLQKQQNLRLGEVLRQAGLLSERELQRALDEQQRRKGRRLGEVLVDLGVLTERDLAVNLGLKFAMPFIEAHQLVPSPQAVALVGRDLLERYRVLPVSSDERTLTVAVADPADFSAIDALRSATGRRVHTVIATASAINRLVEEQVRRLSASVPAVAATAASPSRSPEQGRSTIADDGVGKLLNDLLLEASRRDASDLYIEANGKQQRVTVRQRVDGQWRVQAVFPPIVRNALVARLKAAATLDVNERQRPQRGIMRWSLGLAQALMQVTTLPNAAGDEDVALRLRAPLRAMALGALGLSPENLLHAKQAMGWRRGLILCAGPTRSGKTTLMHALLGALPQQDAKISSAESPIEIVNPACRQLSIAPTAGPSLATGARMLLEADPDVLMLGELHDDETARLAIEGVLRGHLVLAGVVAERAVDGYLRMECAGIQPALLARIPTCVIATRTVRALCPHCAARERATPAELDQLARAYGPRFAQDFGGAHPEPLPLSRARGCERCAGSGYAGLIGVQEIVTQGALPAQALSPFDDGADRRTLAQDAVSKVMVGRIDLLQLQGLSLV